MISASMRTCLVVLNIGSRPFLDMTRPFFERYCQRTNTDLRIITRQTLSKRTRFLSLFNRGRRDNILAYVQKLKSVDDALEDYSRVILMDDTCIISGSTPDLATLVPDDAIGAYSEQSAGFVAYQRDRDLVRRLKGVEIGHYPNTGMLVVPRTQRALVREQNLRAHRDLFFSSPYPSQAYLSYMLALHRPPFVALDDRFNYMHVLDYHLPGNRDLTVLPEEHIVSSCRYAYIHHLTGYYKHRGAIIRQICDHLSRSESAAAP